MMDIDVKNLHPLEIRLLRHVSLGEAIDAKRLIGELGYNVGQCNQSFSWLEAKGFIKEEARIRRTLYELTDVGRFQAQEGTPAERIFQFLK
ncbi:MAG TPA: phenylalanine--tRNA ligase subunit alpha, partial [Sphaerochaeta sp.]|nr:phenylalanine--tRNA ligase subunit alpha [Sphaerochaeta sp.]